MTRDLVYSYNAVCVWSAKLTQTRRARGLVCLGTCDPWEPRACRAPAPLSSFSRLRPQGFSLSLSIFPFHVVFFFRPFLTYLLLARSLHSLFSSRCTLFFFQSVVAKDLGGLLPKYRRARKKEAERRSGEKSLIIPLKTSRPGEKR